MNYTPGEGNVLPPPHLEPSLLHCSKTHPASSSFFTLMKPIIHQMNIILHSIILETSDWDSSKSIHWGNESDKRWVIFLLVLLDTVKDEGTFSLISLFKPEYVSYLRAMKPTECCERLIFSCLLQSEEYLKWEFCLTCISISGKLLSSDKVNYIPPVRTVLWQYCSCNWDQTIILCFIACRNLQLCVQLLDYWILEVIQRGEKI